MSSVKRKVAIIGTNGIPAKYGGFETLAEQLVEKLSEQFDFTVYCNGLKTKEQIKNYKGAKLVYLPINANGWQSVMYDLISIIHALFKSNTLVVMGLPAGFFFFLNLFFRRKIIVNHGGLNEWERPKYSKLARFWSFNSRKVAVRFASVNIGDNPLIIESLNKNFNAEGIVIEYGGDHAVPSALEEQDLLKYPFLESFYGICVARAQIDNNIHLVIDAYKNIPEHKVVIVSNWAVTKYGLNLYEQYKNKYPNIVIQDAIYDPRELNLLRSNAGVYIHSHSFCGTAPSLVEAMSLVLPIVSFDVPTNRYTTKNQALYFKNVAELTQIVSRLTESELLENKEKMYAIAREKYTWERIASLYAKLF